MLIVIIWVAGLWLIGKSRSGLPWHEEGEAPDNQQEPHGHAEQQKDESASRKGVGTGRAVVIFSVAAFVTLVGGVVLERSSDGISSEIGMSGVVFASTFLAAATALPEVSTGLTSVRLGDYQLSVSDIFGGNAFLPVLFLVATVLSGQAVLERAQNTDIYLDGLGVLLTTVYIYGLIFRPRTRILRMGVDSLAVLILYAVGIVGLVAVAGG